jgi:hypothetical protein
VQPVLVFGFQPITQLGFSLFPEEHCSARGFSIVGKLAQTVFQAVPWLFHSKSSFLILDTEGGHSDFFPSWSNL